MPQVVPRLISHLLGRQQYEAAVGATGRGSPTAAAATGMQASVPETPEPVEVLLAPRAGDCCNLPAYIFCWYPGPLQHRS